MNKFCEIALIAAVMVFGNDTIAAKDIDRIYVSPSGNDRNSGSLKAPLRNIATAIARSEASTAATTEIILRDGSYQLDSTLEIGSGKTAGKLVLKAENSGHASISGGRKVAGKAIRKVSDPAVLDRLQPEVKGRIYEIDLKRAGIPCHGLRPSGFGRPSLSAWTELFEDGNPHHIARWPNDTTVLIGKIHEPGTGENRKEAPCPVFEYIESRPERWVGVDSFWIGGYFAHGYADDMIKAARVDTATHTIHTAQHTVYGFMTGAPWRRWYALNLLEELDMPGEYVLDEKKEKLYFYPVGAKPGNINVSVIDAPLLAVENCNDVTVEGIVFEYGRSMAVYMENTRNVLVRDCTIRNMGGVGVSVGAGSYAAGKKHLRPHSAEAGGDIVHRMIGDLQGKVYEDVLFNRNAGKNNGIADCRIYNVGAGGISLGGGDRATLDPAGNYVENCRIHDFNRIEKSYRAGIWMDGTGCRISGCDIYNAPSMAILFHGNNHLIEKCHITNVCGEVDDQGAVYYGRDPSERGHVIRYNYFHRLSPRHRVTATYHDDGACGAELYGNIYHEAGSMPVLIGGGHDNTYRNNIFIDCPLAVHIDNRMQGWGSGMVAKDGIIDRRLKSVRYTESPYSTAYPELMAYWDENPAYPKRNLFEGNLFYRIGNLLSGRNEWAEFVNNWATTADPGFIDPDNPLKGFRPDAAVFSRIKDFPEIPFSEIGCSLPADDSDNR